VESEDESSEEEDDEDFQAKKPSSAKKVKVEKWMCEAHGCRIDKQHANVWIDVSRCCTGLVITVELRETRTSMVLLISLTGVQHQQRLQALLGHK
jgi:hypothetical protein